MSILRTFWGQDIQHFYTGKKHRQHTISKAVQAVLTEAYALILWNVPTSAASQQKCRCAVFCKLSAQEPFLTLLGANIRFISLVCIISIWPSKIKYHPKLQPNNKQYLFIWNITFGTSFSQLSLFIIVQQQLDTFREAELTIYFPDSECL